MTAHSADDILNKVVQGWLMEGQTTFVFENVPNRYQTAQDVSKRLPVATLPYAKNYAFDWGNGSQIVIRFNSTQAEWDQKALQAVKTQGAAISKATEDPNLRFKKAFDLVANSVTYTNKVTENRQEQTMACAIFNHYSNCNGYATWLTSLLNEMGIPAYKVVTETVGEAQSHAIVRVWLNGRWYYSDPSAYSVNPEPFCYDYYLFETLPKETTWKNTNLTEAQEKSLLQAYGH